MGATDNVFVLHGRINHLNKGKMLCCTFVDFKKPSIS